MAEISQNVNIEMLEKLPDGTYKRKYPKTRADDGTTFDEHLAESTQQAHLAKNIGIEDVAGNFVATEVEGAMSELFTNVSNGKDLVGGAITDVDDSVVIPTEPSFGDLASAIGQISTGRRWAAGIDKSSNNMLTVSGIGFKPSLLVITVTRDVGTREAPVSMIVYVSDFSATHYKQADGEYMEIYGDMYVNSEGFKLYVATNTNMSWIAIE